MNRLESDKNGRKDTGEEAFVVVVMKDDGGLE